MSVITRAWWAIMAAPLIAGNDTRSQSAATSAILEAPEIIAVDQDSAGHQGTRVWDGGNGQNIWSKTQSGTNVRVVFVLNGSSATTSITSMACNRRCTIKAIICHSIVIPAHGSGLWPARG